VAELFSLLSRPSLALLPRTRLWTICVHQRNLRPIPVLLHQDLSDKLPLGLQIGFDYITHL